MTEVQQGPSHSTCLLQRGVRFNEVSIKRQLTLHVKRVLQLLVLYQDFLNNPQFNTQIVACVHLPFTPQKSGEGFLHAGIKQQYQVSNRIQNVFIYSLGLILSAFFFGYVITQIPGGWLSMRFGGKKVLGFGVLFAALLSLITPFVARTNVYLLVIVRGLMGFVLVSGN